MATTVDELLQVRFKKRDLASQRDIVRSGPPQPALPGLLVPRTVGSVSFEHCFDTAFYEHFPWMAGCSKRSRLFCWPCLLYSDSKGEWSRDGLSCLKKLRKLAQAHEANKAHTVAAGLLKRFQWTEVDSEVVPGELAKNVVVHNQKVDQLRYILSYHASLLALLAYQDSPLMSHAEKAKCDNLMKLLIAEMLHDKMDSGPLAPVLEIYLPKLYKKEPKLKFHVQNSKSPFYNLRQVQTDLAQVMGDMFRNMIQHELDQAPFASIKLVRGVKEQMDGKTSLNAQVDRMAVYLRYVLHDKIIERYVDYSKVSKRGIKAQHIIDLVSKVFHTYEGLEAKLVSLTFDSLALTRHTYDELRDKMRERYPHVVAVAQPLDGQVRSHLQGNIRELFEYHLKSPPMVVNFIRDCCVLHDYTFNNDDDLMKEKHVEAMDTGIDTVRANKHLEVYREFLEPCNFRVKPPYRDERGILADIARIVQMTTSFDTIVLLRLFAHWQEKFEELELFIKTNLHNVNLCALLARYESRPISEDSRLSTFIELWTEAKERFFDMRRRFQFDSNLTPHNMNQYYPKEKRAPFLAVFDRAMEVVQQYIEIAYGDLPKLIYFNLLNPELCRDQRNEFPQALFDALAKSGHVFDFDRLKAQLVQVYQERYFCKDSILMFYQHLCANELCGHFSEVAKLAQLMLTTSPYLCGVGCVEMSISSLYYQRVSKTLVNRSSDAWTMVVLNKELTKRLHPAHLKDMNHEETLLELISKLSDAISTEAPQVPIFSADRVVNFRDLATEDICHRYCLRSGLGSLLYHQSQP